MYESKMDETDYKQIRDTAQGRMDPSSISSFFMVAFAYGAIIGSVFIFGVGRSNVPPMFSSMAEIIKPIIMFQAIVAILFRSKRLSFGVQRLQSVLLCAFSIKLSVDFYLAYFLLCAKAQAPDFMYTSGIVALGAGFLVMMISVRTGVERAKQGHLRDGGEGLFNTKTKMWRIASVIALLSSALAPMIPGVTRIIARGQTQEHGPGAVPGLMFPLFLAIIIQYGVGMGFAELFLLSWCKIRFKSFKITEEEVVAGGQNK